MIFRRKILSNFSELRELEEDFESFLKVNRIPSDIIYDLKMAVHEYALNVIEHGYHWATDKEIEFEAVIVEKDRVFEIEVVIKDKAPKFEISKEKIIKEADSKSFRGRGLIMILTFVDDIVRDSSYDEGNRVILKKKFSLGLK
ncbi:MAG: ATP-binding protein [Brevinematia bacterium]